VSNHCPGTTPGAPYFPCLVLYWCCIAVEGYSLVSQHAVADFKKVWSVGGRTAFSSTKHTIHFQNNCSLQIRSLLFVIWDFIQGRSKSRWEAGGEDNVLHLWFGGFFDPFSDRERKLKAKRGSLLLCVWYI